MALEEIYSDEHSQVFCNKDKQLVQVTWLKHCSGEPLRKVLLKALQCANAHELTAWLCDIRKLYYIELGDRNWMLRKLFPSFDKKAQHQVALLLSHRNFEVMATIPAEADEAFEREFASFINMNYFVDKEEAEEWLNL